MLKLLNRLNEILFTGPMFREEVYGIEVEYHIHTDVPGFENYYHTSELWRTIYQNAREFDFAKYDLDHHIDVTIRSLKDRGYIRFDSTAIPWHRVVKIDVLSRKYFYKIEDRKVVLEKTYMNEFPWEKTDG